MLHDDIQFRSAKCSQGVGVFWPVGQVEECGDSFQDAGLETPEMLQNKLTEPVGEAKLEVVEVFVICAGPVDVNTLPGGSSPNFSQEPLQPWAWVCLY